LPLTPALLTSSLLPPARAALALLAASAERQRDDPEQTPTLALLLTPALLLSPIPPPARPLALLPPARTSARPGP
jgi:hypothetical protein